MGTLILRDRFMQKLSNIDTMTLITALVQGMNFKVKIINLNLYYI